MFGLLSGNIKMVERMLVRIHVNTVNNQFMQQLHFILVSMFDIFTLLCRLAGAAGYPVQVTKQVLHITGRKTKD